MRRRFVCAGVALAIVCGLGLAPVEAKGRCREILAGTERCLIVPPDGSVGREFVLLDRRCRTEGRTCSQDGSECTTLYRTVECLQEGDGGSTVRVGAGCFCGGGSVGTGTDRDDPVSAEEFLRIQEALESHDGVAGTCELPASLQPEAEE